MRYTKYMPKKQDISYGVVPLYKSNSGEYEVLIIHQRSWTGEQFWIFPKGHPEGTESPKAAAARELQEETGVTEVTIETQPSFSMQYIFTHEGNIIKKTVTYFLGFVANKDTEITQPDEVIAVRWCSLTEAQDVLSHENSRSILKKIRAYVQTLPA